MQEFSGALAALRAPETLAPGPGFYARVSQRVESQRPRSGWGLFWLYPAFGKRVAFASLMTLAVLGTYLITRETDYSAGPPDPEVVMAQQAPSQNPDTMLATLAAYEEP
jgi:hypothetical protein